MPHPYVPKGKVKYGPDALLERPQLAAYIGAVATSWTIVEELWGMLLAQLLDADAKTGIDLYLALPGSAAQMAVVRSMAEARMPADLRPRFADLIKAEKGRARERNTIVHGRWAIDPEEPEGLLLAERDWLPRSIADILHFYRRQGANALAPAKYAGLETTFVIYRERDFKATLSRLEDFSHEQTTLGIKISSRQHAQESTRLGLPPQSEALPDAPDPPHQTNREEPG